MARAHEVQDAVQFGPDTPVPRSVPDENAPARMVPTGEVGGLFDRRLVQPAES